MSELSCYDFKSFKFGRHSHISRDNGMCIMEAVAYIAGEKHSDCPKCADPTITNIAIILNDNIEDNDERDRLLSPFLWRIVGTNKPEYRRKRRSAFMDFLAKHILLDNLHSFEYYHMDDVYCYFIDDKIDEFIRGRKYCRKEIFNNVIKPNLLKLLDELISMTEIKEASPELVKEKISNV